MVTPENTWPVLHPRCACCSKGWPEARHRTRFLCTKCYRVACAERTLWKYPKLPKALSNEVYQDIFWDPRRYVELEFGAKHASNFSNDQILAEALNIWTSYYKRWRGEEALIDKISLDIERIVWGTEGVGATEPESADDPAPQPEPVQPQPAHHGKHRPRLVFMLGTGDDIVAKVTAAWPDIQVQVAKHTVRRDKAALSWVISWERPDAALVVEVPDDDDEGTTVASVTNTRMAGELTPTVLAFHIRRLRNYLTKEA